MVTLFTDVMATDEVLAVVEAGKSAHAQQAA
jgi:hypothetical protein